MLINTKSKPQIIAMPSEIRYYPVNWVDGMKISKSHLLSFQYAIDDQIRDSISTSHTSLNFGLLPYGRNPNDLVINVDQAGNIHIALKTCVGITANGCRIQILDDMPLTLTIPSNELLNSNNISFSDEAMFYITVSVNPFKRIPFGNPVENELPPRNPFTYAEYKLELLLSTHVNLNQFESSSLIVGKLSYRKGEFKHHQEFIPACTTLQCHPNFIEFYNAAGDALMLIERSCFLILQKIRLKDQKTSLSTCIYMLSERLGFDISSGLLNFKTLIPRQPPVHLFVLLLHIPNTISTILTLLTAKEREELLTYLGEWTNLSAGSLENKTNDFLINYAYNHNDPLLSLSSLYDYIKMISELFSILSQLEFIGKRKGQSVFIVEHDVAKENTDKTKSRWSPLS
jgi:hypothetical protein